MKNFRDDERLRNWEFIVYDPEPPIEHFKSLMPELSHWAYAYHDKDEGKVPHYHFLIILPNAKTYSAVCYYYDGIQNIPANRIRNRRSAFRYLTHKDNPDKYQYSDDIVKCDDIDWWSKLSADSMSSSGERVDNIIADILAGVSPRELGRRYGSHFALNYNRWLDFAREVWKCEHTGKRFADFLPVQEIDSLALHEVDPDDMPF